MYKAAVTLTLLGSAMAVSGQEAPEAPCSGPEYRQMDFWVGDWQLEYDRPDNTIGTATNRITREFGPCVIVERFAMPNGYAGGSYSIFDRERRIWRQMWVDNQGGTFTLEGGPVEGQPHIFELRTLEPTGRDRALRRMIWEAVAEDRLTWRWQSRRQDGIWGDEWVLRYRRSD